MRVLLKAGVLMVAATDTLVENVAKTMVDELKRIAPLINNNDWNDKTFLLQKAYVSAVFSKLAYLHVPQYELGDKDRIKVVPCVEYQDIVRRGQLVDIKQLLNQSEFEQYFIIEKRYVVIVGVKVRKKVIFVAIRGTARLYDWLDNFNTWRYRFRYYDCFFHRGFFKAIAACFDELGEELGRFDADKVPIYVTGHSLGGAMAAILHAMWALIQTPQESDRRFLTRSAYTFGMPRYGNLEAVTEFRQPYHLYNVEDIVPTVPPKWLGFESCLSEFMLDGTRIEARHSRQLVRFAFWIYSLFSLSGIRHHLMGVYLERINKYIPPEAFIPKPQAFNLHRSVNNSTTSEVKSNDLPVEDEWM